MIDVAIIGFGPRGLSVFDRVIAYSRSGDIRVNLTVHLFDTGPFGVGCHHPSQPTHLSINTVAGQITQFSDESFSEGPILLGPSFGEWLAAYQAEETRLGSAPFRESLPTDPDQYYPRALLGSYLSWVFKYLLDHTPPHVKVVLHNNVQIDDIFQGDKGWVLESNESRYSADFVFVTTGHSKKILSDSENELRESVAASKKINPKAGVIFDPYPIQRSLANISQDHTVAIEGMGLTAFDVLSELTVGRGGCYTRTSDGLVYHTSGNEPKILLFSRSGLPLAARAVNQKGNSGQYKAKFLTFAHVEKMKRTNQGGKLNFKSQILPALLLDMQYAYYLAYLKKSGLATALRFCNDFLVMDDDERKGLVNRYVPPQDQFSLAKLIDPIPAKALESQANFAAWLNHYLQSDVEQALLGNIDSPVKAACDVLRDLRDVLRAAIDFGALDESSHRWLLREFMPIMNRLAVGPPKERIEELIALINCGVVEASFGPRPSCQFVGDVGKFAVSANEFATLSECADVLIQARISLPGPDQDQSRLMSSMVHRGIVRPFMNGQFRPGGIEINRDMNVINRNGHILTNLWALGTLVEGCKFYTFVLARPYVNSTALVDAGRAVGRMVAMIQSNSDYKVA